MLQHRNNITNIKRKWLCQYGQVIPQMTSVPANQAAGPKKEWTFLFYNAGSRDQSKMCASIVRDLETVGSDHNTDIVCLNERWAWGPDKLKLTRHNQGTKLYHVDKNPQAKRPQGDVSKLWNFLTSAPRKFFSRPDKNNPLENQHLGSADSLRQFLDLATQRYPSKHYALIISAHGAGFDGQSVMHPLGEVKSQRITNEELGQVLSDFAQKTGKKMDLVNLNTCLGAGIEVMSPLAQGADVAVASSGFVFAGTQPFGATLSEVQQKLSLGQDVSAAELGKLFVDKADQQPISNLFTATLSAIQLNQIEPLTTSIASLQQHLVEEKVDPGLIKQALEESLRFNYSHHERPIYLTDIGSLAKKLQDQLPKESRAYQDCIDVRKNLEGCVLAEEHQKSEKESWVTSILRVPLSKLTKQVLDPEQMGDNSGLTIYLDPQPQGLNNRTEKVIATELGRKLGMGEFLAYLEGGTRQPN